MNAEKLVEIIRGVENGTHLPDDVCRSCRGMGGTYHPDGFGGRVFRRDCRECGGTGKREPTEC